MINKIIVPLDGSQLAEVALPYAAENAGRTGAEMLLVSVREPHDENSQYMLESYLDKMGEMARTEAAKYQKKGDKPLAVTKKVITGNPAAEIVALADREGTSRIIMATHGKSGISRWAVGSVADKVIRATIRPVTVIRAQGGTPAVHPKGYLEKILVPMDGSKVAEAVLPYLEELAASLKAEITFLFVTKAELPFEYAMNKTKEYGAYRETMKRYMEKLVERFQKKGIKAKEVGILTRREVYEEINDYTRKNYTDIIVMATHGKSGPHRWMLGGTAHKVLMEGNTPLTLVQAEGPFKD